MSTGTISFEKFTSDGDEFIPAGTTCFKVLGASSNESQNSSLAIKYDSTVFIFHEKSGDNSYWGYQLTNRGHENGQSGGSTTAYCNADAVIHLSGASSNSSLAILLQVAD